MQLIGLKAPAVLFILCDARLFFVLFCFNEESGQSLMDDLFLDIFL